ncbi:MAG: LysM peptidoglycan-binding domain-containing protein, partial [Campylobacterota bacterium]|nr:LysM peptidoglycan-binding domain-containing protein [Campylobacterota bacterium]
INDYVDERLDFLKSTKAAAEYLTYLHKRFGKWYLAALAYNCGEGRVSSAIRKAGTDNLKVLLDPKKKYVPLESRIYIRKIVALSIMATDESFLLKSEYGYLLNRASAYSLSVVSVPKGERISRVAKLIDMPVKELKALNSHLKYDFIPPYEEKYDLYIPYIKLSDFRQNYKPTDLQLLYKVHTVVSGDNFSKIGKKYGVKYGIIKDFNNITSNRLSLKQKLIIPIVNTKTQKSTQTVSKSKRKKGMHTVKSGDTLISIARLHKLSVKELRRVNNRTGSMLHIGERLYLK